MKLSELEPHFIRYKTWIDTWTRVRPDGTTHEFTGPREGSEYVDTLAEADGIMFLCPVCFKTNNGSIGTHSVICWFEDKVADDVEPKPGRWYPTGTGIDDLSFIPHNHSNSVLLLGGCGAHFFITLGEIK